MSGSADLVIKVLADTSDASAAFSKLEGQLGKALGVGALGGVVAETTKASIDMQDAMAKIQMAVNTADFAPGTTKYTDAMNQVIGMSTRLATSFDDVAEVMAQASKITGADGFKLTADKINEVTEASIRMQKASSGDVDALTALQDQAILSKLFDNQDFGKTGAIFAALSQQHPQNESTLIDTTIALGQYGSPIGVTEAQAAALSNYLTDTGLGGATGGSSVGRTLQRMNTAADQALDPEAQYSDVVKHRTGQERLDDLHSQLAIAQQRHAQMFGQHGLKTEYRRDPAAVMAADAQISKLQRDIADQEQNVAHLDDAKNNPSRGSVDIASMAATAGVDVTAFAQEFKDSPIQALLDFTRGVHNLPQTEREAALTKAGIVNTRDLKTIMGLTDQPDSIQRMLDLANGAAADPTALNQISDIALGTTSSKLEDLHNGVRAAAGLAGDPGRQAVDAGTSKALDDINKNGFGGLEQKMKDIEAAGQAAAGAVQGFNDALKNVPGVQGAEDLISSNPLLAALVGGAGSKVLAGAVGGLVSLLSGAAPGVASSAAGAASGAAAATPALLGLLGAALPAIGAFGLQDMQDLGLIKDEIDAFNKYVAPQTGQQPIQVNIGDIHSGADLKSVIDTVVAELTAAWNHVNSEHPVSGQLAGDYTTGQGPN